MAVTLTFTIELDTDYHVGAGHGLGAAIDSALLRDRDGVPVLRGTEVEGLLRDGLYRLLQLPPLAQHYEPHCQAQGGKEPAPRFCGQKDPEQENCPLCYLFGSPRTPKRWHFSSARPEGLPEAVARIQTRLGGQTVRRARIDPRTRRAEEGKLFAREMGDSRLRFRFTATCEELTDTETDIELLIAAARMVRHLGASRRRGQGACRLQLSGVEVDGQPLTVDQDSWVERFGQRYLQRQRPPSLVHVEPAVASLIPASDAIPLRLWLLVRTEEPLLVAERSEAANQFDAHPWVPGPTVRGSLAERIAARHSQVQASRGLVYDTFVTLFFRQDVRFPFLYPCQLQDPRVYPMLPAPRDLLSCEIYYGFRGTSGEAHGVRGYAIETHVDFCPQCKQVGAETALKPLTDSFIPLRATPPLVEPTRQTEMHITINPESGRVQAGALYGYVALGVGQYFVGELWCSSQQTWEALRTLAHLPELGQPFTLRLGKATSRGYGRTTAWILPEGDERLWLPQPLSQRVPTPTEPLTLTLLTDTIVQDTWGRFYTSFHEDWLQRELRLAVERPINQFTATASVDAFNTHLGLPRHRDVVLRAGSAVGLRLKEPIPADWQTKLEQCERDGIGLRRSEGLGRVAFNHPLYQGNQGAEQSITLQSGQRLQSSYDHPLSHEAEFQRTWEDRLKRTPWKECEDRQGHFVQIGRLLHASQQLPLETILRLLDFLGDERMLFDQELVGRQKTHFFQNADEGALGVEKIRYYVQQLGEMINTDYDLLDSEQRSRLQQLGLTMLAAKVAEVAHQARQNA